MHKILFYNKFIICFYMFRTLCAHHQVVKIVLYSIWYLHTCRWPSRAQVERVLYYTASGIITHLGSRLVHSLREDCIIQGYRKRWTGFETAIT